MTPFLNNSNQSPISRADINRIEIELENIFHLLNPRAEFRDNLKFDLLTYPKWKILLPRFFRYGFLIAAGIASGIIIVFTGLKTIFTVISAIKIFRLEKSKSSQGNPRSIRSQTATL